MQSLQMQLEVLAPARELAHRNGNFLQHLYGVYEILKAWGCEMDVYTAGLFHSVYGTEFFKSEIFDSGKRTRLIELIGPAAEALAFAFCRLKRNDIIVAAQNFKDKSHGPNKQMILFEADSGAEIVVNARQLKQLLSIEMANLFEQVNAEDGSPAMIIYCLWSLAKAGAEIDKNHPIFMLKHFSEQQEREALQCYHQSVIFDSKDIEQAQILLHRTVSLVDIVAEPYVLQAAVYLDQSRFSEAMVSASKAVWLFDRWGGAWDKRQSLNDWRSINERIIRLAALSVDNANLWPRLCEALQQK